jgi:hypothetical protein
MSVELDVKLGDQLIRKGDLFQSLSEHMRTRFNCNSVLSWEREQTEDGMIGLGQCVLNLNVGDVAEVQCLCYSAGSEGDLGTEGGWWLNVSVVKRNSSSFLLMLVVAACIASIVESDIVDDATLLSPNRAIGPREIFTVIGSDETRAIYDAAESVAKVFSVKFGA